MQCGLMKDFKSLLWHHCIFLCNGGGWGVRVDVEHPLHSLTRETLTFDAMLPTKICCTAMDVSKLATEFTCFTLAVLLERKLESSSDQHGGCYMWPAPSLISFTHPCPTSPKFEVTCGGIAFQAIHLNWTATKILQHNPRLFQWILVIYLLF